MESHAEKPETTMRKAERVHFDRWRDTLHRRTVIAKSKEAKPIFKHRGTGGGANILCVRLEASDTYPLLIVVVMAALHPPQPHKRTRRGQEERAAILWRLPVRPTPRKGMGVQEEQDAANYGAASVGESEA
jgi:hypothetical protein